MYTKEIISFFSETFDKDLFKSIEPLNNGGSDKIYFRIVDKNNNTFIASYSNQEKENQVFVYISNLLKQLHIPATLVFGFSQNQKIILQNDLGSHSLLDLKLQNSPLYFDYYKHSLKSLIQYQLYLNDKIDYHQTLFPQGFDKYYILHDLNYFIYSFAQVVGVSFSYQKVQTEINEWVEKIQNIKNKGCMYRDFQGRNIMISDENPVFIDFQGAMYGPLMYDVASLLWQAKAQLSKEEKNNLLNYYILEIKKINNSFDDKTLKKEYENMTLLRLLQVLGAYGFRGLVQNKKHFIESIFLGLSNLKEFMSDHKEMYIPHEIKNIITQITEENFINKYKY